MRAASAMLSSRGRADLAAIPRRYRLEYAAAADAGARVDDAVWQDGPGWSYRIAGPGGPDLFRATLLPGGGNP